MAATTEIHVLAIPYPAQGHITPMLELCTHLVASGFVFTFVNTEHNHARILQSRPPHFLNDCFRHQGINFVHIPGGLPPEVHGYGPDSSARAFRSSSQLAGPFEQLLTTLMQEGPSVAFILSDALLGWTQSVGTRFGVPRVAFWPGSAAALSAMLHISEVVAQGVSSVFPEQRSGAEILISDIPGLPPTSPYDLPLASTLKDGEITAPVKHFAEQLLPLAHASAVVVNSFHSLEGRVFAARASRIALRPIGPILPSEYLSSGTQLEKVVRTSLFPEDGTFLAWLDKQKPGSVLYISFGSISVRSNEQLLELAMGLEASRHPFLWAIRSNPVDADGSSTVFSEFMERTRGKGVVVRWVPQLQVLAHPAVGGFMTHCGWNSVMESIGMGLPMLCWADTGERRCNQNIAVGCI